MEVKRALEIARKDHNHELIDREAVEFYMSIIGDTPGIESKY